MSAKAFFLPLETRPQNYPPIPDLVGKFWHAGIIHDGKVYECFNHGRNSISDYNDERNKELEKAGAIFVEIIPDEGKIDSEITSGTSCSEYVARVVGMSSNTGPKKEFWPEEVLQFILKNNPL